jgi:hypothetical protein
MGKARHLHREEVVLDGGGDFSLGRHVIYPKGTPMTNLYLTLLERVGVPAESIGDSTGKLEHLSDV